jgi:serine/threonine protein kinase
MDESPEVQDPREERLNAVLGAYLEAGDAGWAPPSDWLLTRYPDLAEELRAFFDAEARVAVLASPPLHSNGKPAPREPQTLPTPDPGPLSSSPASPVTAIGDYASLEVIKAGGMGVVYKAWQKGANRFVALKMIRAGQFATPAEVRRFRDEAEAVANLDHPHIVPIYEVGEHRGLPFFSMKLFEIGSLHQHLERYARATPDAVKMLSTVCRAVHHAHQRGILHRDLKPANILLDAQGQPHVTDFGLAKRLFPAAPPARPTGGAGEAAEATPRSPDPKHRTIASPASDGAATVDEVPPDLVGYMAPEQALKTDDETVTVDNVSRGQTATGIAVGTPGYWAPENTRTVKVAVSTAADVYSLGAILYRLLAGQVLFPTTSRTEAIRLAREGVPDLPRKLNPRADARLEAICMKCLEKDPAQRYASAAALAEDLERWSRGEWPLAWTPPWHLRAWRRARKPLLVGSLTMLASFAVATLLALHYLDPDRVPRALEYAATQGPLTLIGETGPPRYSRWVHGGDRDLVVEAKDAPFSISTFELSQLELLRKPPGPRYRYSAEVRHDETIEDGCVGIYFAHDRAMKNERVVNYWCDIMFADVGNWAKAHLEDPRNPGPRKSRIALVRRRYLNDHGIQSYESTGRYFFTAAFTPVWRKIEVEVGPDKVLISFEGRPVKTVSMADMHEFGINSVRVGDGRGVIPEFTYAPTGALGLTVINSKASFRNVIIEPIK